MITFIHIKSLFCLQERKINQNKIESFFKNKTLTSVKSLTLSSSQDQSDYGWLYKYIECLKDISIKVKTELNLKQLMISTKEKEELKSKYSHCRINMYDTHVYDDYDESTVTII